LNRSAAILFHGAPAGRLLIHEPLILMELYLLPSLHAAPDKNIELLPFLHGDDQIGLRAGPFSMQPIVGLDRPVHLG
jgi:hypothetical protein